MKRTLMTTAAAAALLAMLTACGGRASSNPGSQPGAGNPPASHPGTNNPAPSSSGGSAGTELSGTVTLDGSSTVGPISIAVAEEFRKVHPRVDVPVGISGSSAGIGKFVKREVDIANASRPIKEKELEEARNNGLDPIELPVAYDGLSVVVNKENDFLTCITTEQLHKIWGPESTVTRWNEVDPSWPDAPIKLYGPGTASGTFEYFNEMVNGKGDASRSDFTASEDDNVLVQGVAGDKYAMGYFGYAYYAENKDTMKALAIDAGDGCVEPNDDTIAAGSYPFSRLIYIYPSRQALERPEVKAFVTFYMENAGELAAQVGYTPLPEEMYQDNLAKLK
ncbi:PstS family phosphate ABC transporter substrate-binding protein [Symbiobacterium thermophilum]|nr:PstS family phosphate ABC transporter substrate-binding protein [Symbiobacterium thermophilum]